MLTMGQDIEADRAMALAAVVARVSAVRRQFITDAPGQENTYAAKEREALRWIAETADPDPLTPDPATYRFIPGEIGVTGQDGYQVATRIAELADLWSVVGGRIETARVAANAAVRASTTRAELGAALAALDAALAAATA